MFENRKFAGILILVVFLLSACGAQNDSNEVTVTLTDFGIESSVTTFEAGKTYQFTITNEGAIPHEFVIAEPVMEGEDHSENTEGEMMHEGLVVEVEEDELQPGATVTVDVTFPDHADEELEFACHIEGHYEAGMQSPLTLK